MPPDPSADAIEVYAWLYECVDPTRNHDKFYNIYRAELPTGEIRVAYHHGRNRTRGLHGNKHCTSRHSADLEVEKIRRERHRHHYALKLEGRIEPNAKILELLGLTGVSVAEAADPLSQHEAVSLDCLRLLTTEVGTEHVRRIEELRQLRDQLEAALAEMRARHALVEAAFASQVTAGM